MRPGGDGVKALFGLALFVALIDQTVKWLIVESFVLGESRTVIPGFFNLTLVHNTGGAFGLMARKTWLFIVLSIFTMGFLIWYYRRYRHKIGWVVWPVGLVLGGAIGNLIDRLRLGYVVDFLDVYVKGWHWPAFNIADSAICVGLLVLAFALGKGD